MNEKQAVIDKRNFEALCDLVASHDERLRKTIEHYGYPPFWSRPNTFESLVQIILEQQVSLVSAKAAYLRLKTKISDVTPESLLRLSDEELHGSYFSRQKIAYVRGVATAMVTGELDLKTLEKLSDDDVRTEMTKLKGIGNWTVDVYLIEVLHRPDIFPAGDIAALRALKELERLSSLTKDQALTIAERWRPNRTVATMLLWHQYLASRGRSEEMLAGV